ncbi:hypothetical protein GGS24DRAFT_492145 [Hypoxylon argillaceum]|nr:hypothetical protein GGS24DRAFT_492145 [Hypoxylon argillaceum]
MYWTRIPVLATAIAAGFPSLVNGQPAWAANQVNTTMCAWKGLRAAQLKDTAYIDGGFLYWVAGFADSSLGPPENDGNPFGTIYTLNFSIPFNSNTNFTSILDTLSIGGAANNLAPNYYDGGMLANDDEFFLYGGLLRDTDQYVTPDADDVLSYQVSDYGLVKSGFHPGYVNDQLPGNTTRYVAYGGTANAPSENKAWYFGGYRSPSWGPIYQPVGNASLNPTNVSNTLVTLDLSKQDSETWTNVTLPDLIPSRADPSVVWVPVGEHGILVVLGGVINPYYNNPSQVSLNEAQSLKESPGFMTNIDVYDVASNTWYQQQTTEAPPQLAMGCAVVATAKDASSYNIYYYGGFDGLHEDEDFSDDVWVLSLPSFSWTKLYSGNATHARAGHQCLTPYPDQMVTIGGVRSSKGGGINCLGSILQVFNLTQGEWLYSYDPSVYGEYGVPEAVHLKIGGDYAGGATLTTPTPTGWDTPGLASVFATTYAASKITNYFPYTSQAPANGTRGTYSDSKGGTPSWVAPVLGVVLGLVFVTLVVVGILLYRKRQLFKKNGGSDNSGDESHNFIRHWLFNTGEKAVTITNDDPSSRYDDVTTRHGTPMPSAGFSSPSPHPEMTQHEMPAYEQRYELPVIASPRAELTGDALPYDDILNRHTTVYSPNSPHSRSPHSAAKPASFFTGSVSQEQPSSLSSSQAAMAPMAGMVSRQRPDSPSLGTTSSPSPGPSGRPAGRTSPLNRDTVVSGLSNISDHHMSHLRNLSGATVSSTSNRAGGPSPSPPQTPPATQTGFFHHGPVSPPLPSPPSAFEDHDAGDYMRGYQGYQGGGGSSSHGLSRVPGTTNSLRLSVFRESKDDLGDAPPQGQSHTR